MPEPVSGSGEAGLDRRAFLTKAMAVAIAVPFVGGCAEEGRKPDAVEVATQGWSVDDGNSDVPEPTSSDSPTRVLVVGAGIAGLAVANALATAGIDTIVLEGRTRIGGRVLTGVVGGTPVDLGAAWLEAPRTNPLARLADQIGVERVPKSIAEIVGSAHLFDRDVGWLSDAQRTSVLTLVSEFAAGLGTGDSGTTLGAVIDQAIVRSAAPELDGRWAGHVLRTVVETDTAASVDEIGPTSLSTTGSAEDDVPRGGFGPLVAALATGVIVEHGFDVRTIRVNRDSVTVVAADGRQQTGSHLVSTVPLGVLKRGDIAFEPALPAGHVAAIETLGSGVLEKVVMKFDRSFWNERRPGFLLDDRASRSIARAWIDFSPDETAPLLVALCGGTAGRNALTLTSIERTKVALAALREAFGDLPDPQFTSVTDWTNDPFSRGAYSYFALGATSDDVSALGQPAHQRLLFAGEASSLDRPGTTDGAFRSGIREAKRLLQTPTVTLRVPE